MTEEKLLAQYKWVAFGKRWAHIKTLDQKTNADLKFRINMIKDQFQYRSKMAFVYPKICVIVGFVIMLLVLLLALFALLIGYIYVAIGIACLVVIGIGMIIYGLVQPSQVSFGQKFFDVRKNEFRRHLDRHNCECRYETKGSQTLLTFVEKPNMTISRMINPEGEELNLERIKIAMDKQRKEDAKKKMLEGIMDSSTRKSSNPIKNISNSTAIRA